MTCNEESFGEYKKDDHQDTLYCWNVIYIYGRSVASGSFVYDYEQQFWSLDLSWQLGVLFRV